MIAIKDDLNGNAAFVAIVRFWYRRSHSCVCMHVYPNIYIYIYIYIYMVPPPSYPHLFCFFCVFSCSGTAYFCFFVRDLFSLSQRVDLHFLSFFIPGCLSICLYKPVQIGTSCTGPGPWNQEPRTKIAGRSCPAILVLGSSFHGAGTTCTDLYRFVPVSMLSKHTGRYKPVQIGTSCTGPIEPRTKNQGGRARPPCNLGSWFLVPGAGLLQLAQLCTGLYRPVCLDKFKDLKGFRKFKWAGPFPKIAILSQIFKGLRNLRILKNSRAGPFPE